MNAESAALGIAGVMTAAFLVLLMVPSGDTPELEEWEITSVCIDEHNPKLTHTHANLSIEIDGEKYHVGPNVGISDSMCDGMRGIHTHDDTGILHIETPSPMDAPIGAVFEIWGKEFSESQIIDSIVDENSEIVMYVNGESSDQFASYSMQDGDVIEIVYRDK